MTTRFTAHITSPMLVEPTWVGRPRTETRLTIKDGDIELELTFSEAAREKVVAALTERTTHRSKIPMKE